MYVFSKPRWCFNVAAQNHTHGGHHHYNYIKYRANWSAQERSQIPPWGSDRGKCTPSIGSSTSMVVSFYSTNIPSASIRGNEMYCHVHFILNSGSNDRN